MLDISEENQAVYKKPNFLVRFLFNPLVSGATRLGLSMRGSRVLAVRGRESGKWRTTPVNPLRFEGERYLVAPRGDTHWVRNIRATGEGRLSKGRTTETIRVEELGNEAKVPLLRAYLKEWAWETKKFFELEGSDFTDEQLAQIAPKHPVFRIVSGNQLPASETGAGR